MPFWSIGWVLYKYGFLEIYWLYNEWWNHFSRVTTFTVLQWLLNQCNQPKNTFVFNAPLWSWVCGSRFSLVFTNNKLNLLPQTQLHSGALNTKVNLGWSHWLRSHCNAVKVATREKWPRLEGDYISNHSDTTETADRRFALRYSAVI